MCPNYATPSDHSYPNLHDVPLCETWKNMRARCYNSRRPDFQRYGGRGITIAPSLQNFGAFSKYVMSLPGYGDPNLSLDRIDNDGNYEPGNLRWATATEQARNRRSNKTLTFHGETITLQALANRTGVKRELISFRVNQGMSVEDAVETPVKVNNSEPLTYQGKTMTQAEWAKDLGIGKTTINERLRRGWSVEKTLATLVAKR